MVIALNDFEGLCGFRCFEEIQYFIQNIPELQEVLGLLLQSSLSHSLPPSLPPHFLISFLLPSLYPSVGKGIVSKMSSDSTCTGTDQCKIALKNCFTALMNQDPSIVKRQLDRFQERLKEERKMQRNKSPNNNRVLDRSIMNMYFDHIFTYSSSPHY